MTARAGGWGGAPSTALLPERHGTHQNPLLLGKERDGRMDGGAVWVPHAIPQSPGDAATPRDAQKSKQGLQLQLETAVGAEPGSTPKTQYLGKEVLTTSSHTGAPAGQARADSRAPARHKRDVLCNGRRLAASSEARPSQAMSCRCQ